jgi:hypothetical protein
MRYVKLSGGWRNERAALLALVRSDVSDADVLATLEQADLDRLIEIAALHRITTIVHKRLIELGVGLTPLTAAMLDRRLIDATARRLHVAHTISMITRTVSAPFLVVKGPVLAADWYGDPSDRDFGDLDVLVRRRDFTTVVDDLISGGFEEMLYSWDRWISEEVAEIPLRFEATIVDLHWSLIAIGHTRSAVRLSDDEMFDRSIATSVGRLNVATLDAADTLIHLCVNTGLGGGRRLRNLVDIDVVVRSGRVDLDEFVERCRAAGVERMAAPLLTRCHRLLGTPLPQHLITDLSRAHTWLMLNRLVDRWVPSTTNTSIAPGLLISSGRQDASTTTKALMRSLREYTTRWQTKAAAGKLDWNRRPLEGDVSWHRDRYLSWVAGRDSARDGS